MAENPTKIRLDGKRFGRWTVLQQAGNHRRGAALWLCRCECGTERPVLGGDLRWGKSLCCGCSGSEKTALRNFRHGRSNTRLYNIWQLMRARCQNPKDQRYGGRGIRVCDSWNDFKTFCAWALTAGYSDNLTIERVDSAGGYCPENCTWADYYTQAQNRSITIRMPDGTPAIVVARQNGVSGSIYRRRLSEGWPIELAVSWPKRKRRVPRETDSFGRFI